MDPEIARAAYARNGAYTVMARAALAMSVALTVSGATIVVCAVGVLARRVKTRRAPRRSP